MGGVVDAVKDFVNDPIGTVVDALEAAWDKVVEPILEPIFAILGITDETIVHVKRVSTLIYGDNTKDTYQAAITRAILIKKETNTGFFENYMHEIWQVKGQVRAAYRYAELGLYIHGLPDMEIRGTVIDFVAVKAAIDADLGDAYTILSARSTFPSAEVFIKHELQTSHAYLPYVNTLTDDDEYGANWSDWNLEKIVYNAGLDNYTVHISRQAEEAKFWIEGPNQITEGDTATFTIKSNRLVPVGESVIVNFSYIGTAIDAIDYFEVASVVMLASTDEITVDIITVEKGINSITGVVTITFSTVSIVRDPLVLFGLSTIGFSLTGKLTSTIPITGTISIVFAPLGTGISNPLKLTGLTLIALSLNGTLTGANADPTFTIAVDSITNTNAAFEKVAVYQPRRAVSCVITDDNSLKLTVDDILVNEANVTITITVKLEEAAPSGAFTVDYNFTDVTAIGGVDYDNTTGTLNFAGTLGETQDIDIDIYADIVDDDYGQFLVWFDNSNDIDSINISAISTVTIIDGTSEPLPITQALRDTIIEPSFISERHLVATYHLATNPAAQWFYWLYPYSDGTYLNLEPDVNSLVDLEMLPVAILRKDKVNADINKTLPLYLTTRLLMQRLQLGIDEFLEALSSNPNISDVDDAFVNFSMSPNTVHEVISRMLFLTYYELIVVNLMTSNNEEYTATFREGDVNSATAWTAHSHTTGITGVKTTEGEYLHEVVQTSVQEPSGETDDDGNPINPKTVTGSALNCWFQATATEYDEIVVNNLNGMSAIEYDGFHKMALNKIGDDDFVIPVSWFVFNQLTAKQQLEVYQYLLRFDIFAIQIVELEWYETSAFFDLFTFAMIVFTVYTLGAASSLWVAVQQIAIQYAIGELIVWVVEATGSAELAALIGVVAIIYLSDSSVFSEGFLPEAEELLNLATNYADNLSLAQGVQDSQEAADLADDIKELSDRAKANVDEGRGDLEPGTVDPEFISYLKSIDTTIFPAIQGQYDYDAMYDYDSLVGNFVDIKLLTWVN